MKIIYTIGTQGMHDDDFLNILNENEIDAVIDIRLHNEGRWYRFASGKHIKDISKAIGIDYIHNTQLAPTKEMLIKWREEHNWQDYEDKFINILKTREALSIWDKIAKNYPRPCLLCAEKLAETCHRRLLAEYLIRNGRASRIIHLSKN